MKSVDNNSWVLRDSDGTDYESYYNAIRPAFMIKKFSTVTTVTTTTFYFEYNPNWTAAELKTAMDAAWTGRGGLSYGDYPEKLPENLLD